MLAYCFLFRLDLAEQVSFGEQTESFRFGRPFEQTAASALVC